MLKAMAIKWFNDLLEICIESLVWVCAFVNGYFGTSVKSFNVVFLLKAVQSINMTHDSAKTQMDVKVHAQ